MKNRILSGGAVNLTVVAFLTLLFAGCAVAPKTENLSVGATSMHSRTEEADDYRILDSNL